MPSTPSAPSDQRRAPAVQLPDRSSIYTKRPDDAASTCRPASSPVNALPFCLSSLARTFKNLSASRRLTLAYFKHLNNGFFSSVAAGSTPTACIQDLIVLGFPKLFAGAINVSAES